MADPSIPTEAQQQQMQAVLQAPIMRLYANGFMMGQSAADIVIALLVNGVPSAVLNLSYMSAKTLQNNLAKLISEFERVTGQIIPIAEEVGEKLAKTEEKK
jgi:hypothetical protein